ncbi:uncharacterized protein G2W53_043048 [Senna tora]|uniref:Uncharacterized protein n=1 Tax=Senna tora TaxID=362788 RepID=A0A834SI15_9FABA|nr:uncharacterized protein G2W53_043048 [Senna tora]
MFPSFSQWTNRIITAKELGQKVKWTNRIITAKELGQKVKWTNRIIAAKGTRPKSEGMVFLFMIFYHLALDFISENFDPAYVVLILLL